MKDTLLEILTLLLALAQNPKANEDEAAKVQGFVNDALLFTETAHGDSELNDPAIKDKINDLAIVLGSSEPDPEHAEVPEFEDEAAPEAEAEAAEEQTETDEDREAERLAAEEAAKPKAAPKKILTIKEKREMAEKAAAATKPAPPKSGLKKK